VTIKNLQLAGGFFVGEFWGSLVRLLVDESRGLIGVGQ
jgi:hypothetical protein